MASTSTLSPKTHTFHPLPSPADNGLALSTLFLSSGPHSTIFLLPYITYPLYTPIHFSHSYNTLATLGFPAFEEGSQAVLETRGEAQGVGMVGLSGVALRRVHIRGCRGWGRRRPAENEREGMRGEGKMGWVEGGAAMVEMGGPGSCDALVEGCRLEDPRGWSAVSCVGEGRDAADVGEVVARV